MKRQLVLKVLPLTMVCIVLLRIAFRKYSGGSSWSEGESSVANLIDVGVISFGIWFYVLLLGTWFLRGLQRTADYSSVGYILLFSIAIALASAVTPAGGVFRPHVGFILKLPAWFLMSLAENSVAGPGERIRKWRSAERARLVESLARGSPHNDFAQIEKLPLEMINGTDGENEVSLVAVAIQNNQVDLAKSWIARGAKVDEGSLVLYTAAGSGDLNLLKSLVELGAGPTATRGARNPIWNAFVSGQRVNFLYLAELARKQDPEYPEHLFWMAIMFCNASLAQEALKLGANPLQIKSGRHPFDLHRYEPNFLFTVVAHFERAGEGATSEKTIDLKKNLAGFFKLAKQLGVDFNAKNSHAKTIFELLEEKPSWMKETLVNH